MKKELCSNAALDLAREKEHLNTIFEQLQHPLIRFAHSVCGSADLAEDLYTHAAYTAFRYLEAGKLVVARPVVSAFLRQAIRNEYRNYVTKKSSREEALSPDHADVAQGISAEVIAASQVSAILRQTERIRLRILLLDSCGYSNKEIAKRVQLSREKVAGRLYALKAKLRRADPHGYLFPTKTAITAPEYRGKVTKQGVGLLMRIAPPANGWLTQNQIENMAPGKVRSQDWLSARLSHLRALGRSEPRTTKEGQLCIHYHPDDAQKIVIQACEYPLAADWLNLELIKVVLNKRRKRKVKIGLVTIELLLTELKMAPEKRIALNGVVTDHWSPDVIPKLRILVRKYLAPKDWLTLPALAKELNQTWKGTLNWINKFGLAEYARRRINEPLRCFDTFYPLHVLVKLKALQKPAQGWLTDSGVIGFFYRNREISSYKEVRPYLEKLARTWSEIRLDKRKSPVRHWPRAVVPVIRALMRSK